MSMDNLRRRIYEQFKNNWSATASSRVVYGDNRNAKRTEDGSWVRLSFNILENTNAQIGQDFQRARGFINLQIFVKKNSGEKAALELFDAFQIVFENQSFNNVVCYTAMPIRVGEEGSSYQLNGRVEFEYNVFS